MPIFLGCGIFGASSTGAAGASTAALKIVNENLEADDAYKNLRNKAITSKKAFERAIPDEFRDSLLECARVNANFRKYQKRLNSCIIRKREIIDSIDTFIENNRSSIPQEIIAWKADIARLDKIDASKTDLSSIQNNERLDKRENTPIEFIKLIDEYLKTIDQIIDSRISVDIAAKSYRNFLEYKEQGLIDENLMNLYYDAQRKLDEYQKNLAPVCKEFRNYHNSK